MADLSNEKGIIVSYLAVTGSDKFVEVVFDPRMVPTYATKLMGTKLVFQKVKMGAFINHIVKFRDTVIEVELSDIASVKKAPRILGFLYNITWPRFKITMRDGKTWTIILPAMQNVLAGKDRYEKGAREALIDKLLSL